jgi:hypothetical protein
MAAVTVSPTPRCRTLVRHARLRLAALLPPGRTGHGPSPLCHVSLPRAVAAALLTWPPMRPHPIASKCVPPCPAFPASRHRRALLGFGRFYGRASRQASLSHRCARVLALLLLDDAAQS